MCRSEFLVRSSVILLRQLFSSLMRLNTKLVPFRLSSSLSGSQSSRLKKHLAPFTDFRIQDYSSCSLLDTRLAFSSDPVQHAYELYMGYSPSVRSKWLDIAPSSFFACLWTERKSASHVNKAWSIKDLLYGIKHQNMINFPYGTNPVSRG